jgi:hypothetical protein
LGCRRAQRPGDRTRLESQAELVPGRN